MEKRIIKSNWLPWALTIFAAVCGVTAFFMFFAQAVVFDRAFFDKTAYSGLQTAFGYKANGIRWFNGSAGVALAFIFPLIGSGAAVMGKGNPIATVSSAALYIAGGVLAFCIPQLLSGQYIGSPELGAGAVACGVLSTIGAVTECASLLVKE